MRKTKLLIITLSILTIAALAVLFFYSQSTVVMNPEGAIAARQRYLIIFAAGLMAIIVIPIFVMLFFIAWRYRADNKKAAYHPEWDHNPALETAWWGIPIIIIGIIAVVTWQSSHALDPHKPLESEKKPLKVQVVALQWKWLFIYPEQKVATVNYLRFPEKQPIDFELTADAPMNSFWIPALGSQIYAMPGMNSRLHLIADKTGTYEGASANISGEGFAGMRFKAEATNEESFTKWVHSIRNSNEVLDGLAYNQLAQPSRDQPTATFALAESGLYDTIINKYTRPPASSPPGEAEAHSHDGHGGE